MLALPGDQIHLSHLGRAHTPLPGLYVELAENFSLAAPGAISWRPPSGYHELPADASLRSEKSRYSDTGNSGPGLSHILCLCREKASLDLDRSSPIVLYGITMVKTLFTIVNCALAR